MFCLVSCARSRLVFVRTLRRVLSCCLDPVCTLLFLRRAMGPGICPRSTCIPSTPPLRRPVYAPRAHRPLLLCSSFRSLGCSRRTTAGAAPASVYLNRMVVGTQVTNHLGLPIMNEPTVLQHQPSPCSHSASVSAAQLPPHAVSSSASAAAPSAASPCIGGSPIRCGSSARCLCGGNSNRVW